jgi:hypothetical protein
MRSRSGSNLTQDIARTVLTAILTENYDLRELRQIARKFQVGEFDHLLYVLIEDVCFNLNPKESRLYPPESEPVRAKKPAKGEQSPTDRLLAGIRKKKMSRERCARKVEDALELPKNSLVRADPPMDALVNRLLSEGTPAQIGRVEADLGLGDAYLSGISSRF